MPEMHLRQPRFTYIAFGPFIKNKEKLQTFKETDSKYIYIYQIELDKACFQHNIAYGGFENLPTEPAADKVLHDKAFNIAQNPKYVKYQRDLASMV